jgi:hypothetical protein
LFVVVDGLDHLLGPGEITVARAVQQAVAKLKQVLICTLTCSSMGINMNLVYECIVNNLQIVLFGQHAHITFFMPLNCSSSITHNAYYESWVTNPLSAS